MVRIGVPTTPLTAAEVWAYATRALTDKAGFTITEAWEAYIDAAITSRLASADFNTRLSSTRAARIDNVDAAVSSRKIPGYAVSDTLLLSSDAEVNVTGTIDYTKVKENRVLQGGYRIKFDMKSGYAGATAKGRIYKNGAPVGTERTMTTTDYVTYSEDLYGWADGDLEQLYIGQSGAGKLTYAQNHRVYGTIAVMAVIT